MSVSRSPSTLFIFSLLLLLLSKPIKSDSNSVSEIRLPSEAFNLGDPNDSQVCPNPTRFDSCPIKCFRPDPVCGADGVTYWCGCADAHCSGTRVAKLGFCEVGNGGSGPLSGQALLLVHIVWLIVVGVSVLFGLL